MKQINPFDMNKFIIARKYRLLKRIKFELSDPNINEYIKQALNNKIKELSINSNIEDIKLVLYKIRELK